MTQPLLGEPPESCKRCGNPVRATSIWVFRGQRPYCKPCFDILSKEPTQPDGPVEDPVNHPTHYTAHPSGIECITVTRHFNFNRGNAIKYIWRAGAKGDEVEDLRKAVWYLTDEIKRLEEARAKERST